MGKDKEAAELQEIEATEKPAKKSKPKNKKPNIFKRFGRKCKEVFSELKKVTWPSFGKVVKNTGIVLAVVVVFLVVITVVDFGLSAGLGALVGR